MIASESYRKDTLAIWAFHQWVLQRSSLMLAENQLINLYIYIYILHNEPMVSYCRCVCIIWGGPQNRVVRIHDQMVSVSRRSVTSETARKPRRYKYYVELMSCDLDPEESEELTESFTGSTITEGLRRIGNDYAVILIRAPPTSIWLYMWHFNRSELQKSLISMDSLILCSVLTMEKYTYN